ncbi:sulfotransferase family 2 domain-containing protein [Salipiger sp. PrR002]|uniref:sulfotransferase family 2 domain-containing protein n=1 Tax=Salipiger sp. PrR002 TaxID=2706489 RepID=UPI0013BA76AE|nr:sulfotransferase family 2 domain-containing protein [Salipiger sp. PrR002]NDV98464.1 nodulation protein NodH [Salipiger sp. PrR002]NDW57299.1 nodulation protein NodH [Salipiger sp. PrR004]
MSNRFDSFVVFAEMRTGSNFLETNLNAMDGLTCHGEAFNPHFIGYPNSSEILGVTQAERDADPLRLLQVIRQQTPGGMGGFRFFHDHDPRVLPTLLEDERVAKIVLTRNPVESYVSWKIAQATGQWKLTNVKKRKDAQAEFDGPEFEAHLARLQDFQVHLMTALQTSGQTAFYVAYEDLQNVAVMNGLAKWLGIPARLDALDASLKRQNPQPVAEKVANPDEMERALARLDRFNLSRTPSFEPRRGPVVPSYVAGAETPLIYMPIHSGPTDSVRQWLCALDGADEEALITGFSQKTLRQWKRARPGHRGFTVVRHPLARAYDAFCSKILDTGPGGYARIRKTLRRAHGLPLPEGAPGPDYTAEQHRAAFDAFLHFVKANLAGQTALRIDGHWASQSQCLQGMAEFTLPDMIVREDEMAVYLPALAMQVGHPAPPEPEPESRSAAAPYALADIYDADLEALARDVYQRDYLMFGFGDWA